MCYNWVSSHYGSASSSGTNAPHNFHGYISQGGFGPPPTVIPEKEKPQATGLGLFTIQNRNLATGHFLRNQVFYLPEWQLGALETPCGAKKPHSSAKNLVSEPC
jgi:hypothetical protein